MDEKIKVLCSTIFIDKLSTTDLLALELFLNKKNIFSQMICVDENNSLVLDFKFESYNVSDYLTVELTQLTSKDRKKHISEIAKHLTTVNVIQSNPEDYVKKSPTLKTFVKVYKNKKRIDKAKRLMKIAEEKGINCAFVADTLLI
ncbi:crescent membrane/immature virion protein [Pteropox virus]|uniref:Crescent membrane/immature virion protein n=1 Tax=Pteropox virus TaxID=1873698 RepID=A0A1B1MRL3_9POXV|nr:crescent membrane/immature virion protein [Pteropox virus]ANS71165.1 crescent membrane/immature virion protein [Pteropox virus]